MSAQTPRVFPPIPPESAVSMAWGLTISYSSLEDANTRGQDILDRMVKIRKEVEALPSSDPLKEKHIKYIDSVYSSINASLRNLTSVLQGRNKDYKEIDKLMETQLEKLSSIDKVTANAQSAVPRIFATGGGLSAPFVILQFVGVTLPATV
ncbi:MAG: hypothetical protein HY619_04835, partial [Thaumarchaeota archaeon]|nr:hypothetical protein [Nitrososphaerota archaeon]